MKNTALLVLCILLPFSAWAAGSGPDVEALIRRSEYQVRGNSLESEITMKVVDGSDERSLTFRLWTQGTDKATIKILKPAKDRDTGNLRLGLQLWQFLPNIDRLITIPPSMMLQSWMGSDFTNDDLVRTSSISKDYTHTLVGKERVSGYDTFKIVCQPKPTAPVVWGRIVEWVRNPDAVPLKREFYSERGELLKIMTGTDVKTFGHHTIPVTLTMVNMKKKGAKTIMHYDEVRYDGKIDASIFRQEFLRKPIH